MPLVDGPQMRALVKMMHWPLIERLDTEITVRNLREEMVAFQKE